MKKITTLFAVSLGLLLIATACNFSSLKPKGIPADKKDYVGVWTNETVYLEITEDGMCTYERQTGSTTNTLNGPIQKFSGNNFEAGALGFNKTFKVSHPPHKYDSVWIMVVDGRELVKTEE